MTQDEALNVILDGMRDYKVAPVQYGAAWHVFAVASTAIGHGEQMMGIVGPRSYEIRYHQKHSRVAKPISHYVVNPLRRQIAGVGSWFNPLSWGFVQEGLLGYDLGEQQAIGADRDAQLRELNRQALVSGQITPEEYAVTEQHIAEQSAATANIPGDVAAAAEQGLHEGAQAELGLLGGAVSGAFGAVGSIGGTILKAIPWWVWVGGAIYLFVELGGGGYVERRARAALSK